VKRIQIHKVEAAVRKLQRCRRGHLAMDFVPDMWRSTTVSESAASEGDASEPVPSRERRHAAHCEVEIVLPIHAIHATTLPGVHQV
jgi:hypothetical protein